MASVKSVDRAAVRGSRRHILDWVESPGFARSLTELISSTGAVVDPEDVWMPRGWKRPAEARLETFGPAALPNQVDWNGITAWWLKHPRGANTPNWDLAATCRIEGKVGLVLIEAKAHKNELHAAGKSVYPNASENSGENHEQIRRAIEQARSALDPVVPGNQISVDRCYQLSNRIAHTWWLARAGVPVVLVYLGFLRDFGMRNVGEPFESDEDWQRHFRGHAQAVWPEDGLERWIHCGMGAFLLVVRSRELSKE